MALDSVLTRQRQLVEIMVADNNRQAQGKIAKQISQLLVWLKKRLDEADHVWMTQLDKVQFGKPRSNSLHPFPA